MAESSQHPPPPPGGPVAPAQRPGIAAGQLRALLATLAIVIGSAILGIAGGLVWSAIAPQAVFAVAGHGVAYVVNPETSAFIAADGWFSLIAVAGGLLIGLAGYLFGVRRFGPLPAVGVLVGATVAAFLAGWTGSNLGLAAFRHQLGTSKSGALIRQPVNLGAHGALAFWPLAAGVVVGGIELAGAMRERQRRTAAEPAVLAPLPSDQYGGSGQYGDLNGEARHGGPDTQAPHDGRDGQPGQRQAGWSSDQHDG
jgi:hypothetical protein